MNSFPKLNIIGMAMHNAMKFIPIVVHLHFKQKTDDRRIDLLQNIIDRIFCLCLDFPFKKKEIRTGTRVTAIKHQ